MKNVGIAFKILNGEESVAPTYQDICCHMIFDVNTEYVRRNARFVVGGHTTDTQHAMPYTSVVSMESVIIALTLAALNALDVKMADIERHQSLRKFGLCLVQNLEMILEIVH
jgi:hypothetical protein